MIIEKSQMCASQVSGCEVDRFGSIKIRQMTDDDLETAIAQTPIPDGFTPKGYAEFFDVSIDPPDRRTMAQQEAEAPGRFVAMQGTFPQKEGIVSQYFGRDGTYERVILADTRIEESGKWEKIAGRIVITALEQDQHAARQHYRKQQEVSAAWRLITPKKPL